MVQDVLVDVEMLVLLVVEIPVPGLVPLVVLQVVVHTVKEVVQMYHVLEDVETLVP